MAHPTPEKPKKARADGLLRGPWIGLTLYFFLPILALAWVWTARTGNRQMQVLYTTGILLIAAILWLSRIFFFSRFSIKARMLSLAGILGLGLLGFGLFEYRGLSGDLVPLVGWRWSKPPDTRLSRAEDPPKAEPAVASGTASSPKAFPQFLGPDRSGILTGIGLSRDWAQRPPRLVWRIPMGEGWSGFSVEGRFAVTQEQHGELEKVTCYDLFTGEMLWAHEDPFRMEEFLSGIGPRATPSIADGRVYSLGAKGMLNCLELTTGQKLWSRNVCEENGTAPPGYGASASPLIMDDLVVVVAGGSKGRSLVAYNRLDGEPVWSGGNDPAGYSSPLLTTLAETEQLLVFNNIHLTGHDPSDGKVLWQYLWPGNIDHISQPVPLPGDRIFLSSGYGIGCKLFHLEKDDSGNLSPSLLWETPRLKAKFTNVVHRDGYVYGLDDGVLVCLDLKDGQRTWKRGRYGHGQVLLVDDLLLVQSEKGEVLLLEANPSSHVVLGSFHAVSGKTWNHPALAAPYLLVRNAGEAVCYELPLETPSM